MSSTIALIFCSAFVLLLLRLERKQNPEASLALWIPTVWMLLVNSKPLGLWFRSGGTLETGSPLDRTFLAILLCAGLLILLKRRFDWAAAIRNNSWLIVLVAYMLISILWSSIPGISLKRWVRELVAIVMAFLIASEQNPRLAIKSILRRTIYILLPYSLLVIKYFPAYGREYHRWTGRAMWIGVAPQKNGLALLCIISGFFLLWLLWQRHKGSDVPVSKYQIYIELLLILLSFYLMGGPQRSLSYSATSLIAFAFGLLTFMALIWAQQHGIKLSSSSLKTVVVFIFIYGTVTTFIGRLSFWDPSSIVGRNETLTGRTYIWSTLVPIAMSKPIIGHGVGGVWTTTMREVIRASYAHNGYLEVLLSLGFLGLGLVLLFFLSSSNKATMTLATDRDWGILFVCFMLIALIHNIAESSIYTLETSLTAIILFFSVCFNNDLLIKTSHS